MILGIDIGGTKCAVILAKKIGGICVTAYFFSYVLRNVLSVATPAMIKEDFFTKEYIGLLSSAYFIFYAAGQLINGFIGDRVRSKFLFAIGLEISCLSLRIVPLIENKTVHFACFAIMGFALSMVRGPLTKLVAENTDQKSARLICTLLSAVAFLSPLVASVLAMFLEWRMVFITASALTASVSAIAIFFICRFEKAGHINFVPAEKSDITAYLKVFKLNDFWIYLFISAVGEIVGTSVNFWIPTYMTEYLGLASDMAYTVYSVISFSWLFSPFITLIIYKKAIHNGVKLSCIMYAVSAVSFLLLLILKAPVVNVLLFLIAKMASGCAVGAVWSIYLPGLAKSGLVSSPNGVIDSAGYAAATVANVIFSLAMSKMGWSGIIVMWVGIMAISVIVFFLNFNLKKYFDKNIKDGVNEVKITLLSGNRNLLGPHHKPDGEIYSVGPTTFTDKYGWADDRTKPVWTDNYSFVRFGAYNTKP